MVAELSEAPFSRMELAFEEHPARDMHGERRRPFDRSASDAGVFGIFGERPEEREFGDLFVHAHHGRARHRHFGLGERFAERDGLLHHLFERLDRFGRFGDGAHRDDAACDGILLLLGEHFRRLGHHRRQRDVGIG